jgi:hypothetical protein
MSARSHFAADRKTDREVSHSQARARRVGVSNEDVLVREEAQADGPCRVARRIGEESLAAERKTARSNAMRVEREALRSKDGEEARAATAVTTYHSHGLHTRFAFPPAAELLKRHTW